MRKLPRKIEESLYKRGELGEDYLFRFLRVDKPPFSEYVKQNKYCSYDFNDGVRTRKRLVVVENGEKVVKRVYDDELNNLLSDFEQSKINEFLKYNKWDVEEFKKWLNTGMWTPEDKARGAGDLVAKLTNKIGIKSCGGCKKRQEKLNKLIPKR